MTKDSFNKHEDKLQKEIMKNEREVFNEYIVDLSHNPRNFGKLPDKEISVSQSYTGPCGDSMQFFLKINDNIIKKANFISDGCEACIATASQTMLLIEGKPIDYAEKLNPEDIDKALKGLPEDHKHCTELAARTLKRTIQKYKKNEI